MRWAQRAARGGALAAGCPGGVGAVGGQKFGWRGSGDVALGNEDAHPSADHDWAPSLVGWSCRVGLVVDVRRVALTSVYTVRVA